jgi:hypothetical protein
MDVKFSRFSHDLQRNSVLRKHYQLRGKLVVRQVIVHREECAVKRAFRTHYQSRGKLVMEFRDPLN